MSRLHRQGVNWNSPEAHTILTSEVPAKPVQKSGASPNLSPCLPLETYTNIVLPRSLLLPALLVVAASSDVTGKLMVVAIAARQNCLACILHQKSRRSGNEALIKRTRRNANGNLNMQSGRWKPSASSWLVKSRVRTKVKAAHHRSMDLMRGPSSCPMVTRKPQLAPTHHKGAQKAMYKDPPRLVLTPTSYKRDCPPEQSMSRPPA